MVTPTRYIGDHKIIEIWLYLHKYEELPQHFIPLFRVRILLSHRAFDISLGVNISSDVLIYISNY